MPKRINISLIILLLILLIAGFFRLWKLNEIPPGLYPDVAMNGIDALDTLKTDNFKVFYRENNGREGLFIWLIALSFKIFGPSIWAIKIVSAVTGILTIVGLYLLTNELLKDLEFKYWNLFRIWNLEFGIYKNEVIALLASFLLATSFWHTNFSRIGFRVIMVPFILVFSFYFLLKGLKEKKLWCFIIAGIIFGLGFYTYTGFRFAVSLLPFVFLSFYFLNRKEQSQRKFMFSVFCFLLIVFAVCLPLIIYYLKYPADFTGRAIQITVFSKHNPLWEFTKSLFVHLAIFNIYGDHNWRHNLPSQPMLPWPVGILFVFGIIYSLIKIIKLSHVSLKSLLLKEKPTFNENHSLSSASPAEALAKEGSLFSIFCFLLAWFFVMLLPGVLTAEGIPHALRILGVVPVVYIFAAIGGIKIYSWFYRNTLRKKLLFLAVSLFLLTVGLIQFNEYFVRWGDTKEIKDAFSTNFVEIGKYLNTLPDDIKKYVIVNQDGVPVPYPDGLPVAAQTPIFIERTKFGEARAEYLRPKDISQIKIEGKTIIIPMQSDPKLITAILEKFPLGILTKENGFFIYQINPL